MKQNEWVFFSEHSVHCANSTTNHFNSMLKKCETMIKRSVLSSKSWSSNSCNSQLESHEHQHTYDARCIWWWKYSGKYKSDICSRYAQNL